MTLLLLTKRTMEVADELIKEGIKYPLILIIELIVKLTLIFIKD